MPNRPGFLLPRINWTATMAAPRYAGGHEEVLDTLFLDAEVLFSYHSGDYQGTVGRVYLFRDGIYAVVTDYYGSCSGCDSWEDADDDTARRLITDLSNNAYVAESPDALLTFFDAVREETGTYYAFTEMMESLYPQVHEYVRG